MPLLSCLRPVGRTLQPTFKKIITRNFRSQRSSNRKDGMKLAPEEPLETPRANNMFPGLVKSFSFTTVFCGCAFTGAAIWQHENKKNIPESFNEWINSHWNEVKGWEHKGGDFRKVLNKWWNNLPEEMKAYWQICAINVLVFACWYHPAMRRTMNNFFCSTPAGRAVCWPMLFSCFSHVSLFHLGANMFVLHSFSTALSHSLGKEQYFAFYLCGGMISSLTSHIFKVGRGILGPSLGASGAIIALLGFFCCRHPDSELGIILIPWFTFTATTAIKALICIDTVGIIVGWRFMDHAAHLGGAIFGVWYSQYGQRLTWGKRKHIVENYEKFYAKWKSKIE